MDPVPTLQETVQDLVGKYPELFQELAEWLQEPGVWGSFTINRAGEEPVSHSTERTVRYAKVRSASVR